MTTPSPTEVNNIPWEIIVPVIVALLGALGVALKLLLKGVHRRIDETIERVDKYFAAHERIRDKWDEFLKEYLKIDSTRGQKVDALFRLNDEMKKILDSLPRNVNSKIEEAFTHSISELKLYVREMLSKEQSGV